jgi:hypothetical protein
MFTQQPFTHNFGQQHFGRAALRDRRRTRSLVELADRLVQHPGGSLPEKFHDPNALRRCYDLMNCPHVTHAAVLDSHRQATFERLRRTIGTVLHLHDITELDFTSHRSLHAELGQIGKGYLCHNSLAITPDKQTQLGRSRGQGCLRQPARPPADLAGTGHAGHHHSRPWHDAAGRGADQLDGAPGWLVLWRGWMKLHLLVEGYRAGQRAARLPRPDGPKKDKPGG